MTTEKMTVHMILTELKTIEKRIEKAIGSIVPIGTKENAAKNVNGVSIDDFNKDAIATQQRAVDLIERQNAMKAALYQYNTTKEIEVAGNKMTVAQALWMMAHGMEPKRKLLDHYEKAYAKATKEVEKANGEALNAAAERIAESSYGGKDSPKSQDYLDMLDKYKESHRRIYIDPLNLKDRINDLSEEIEKFNAEVDARIQTANATTEIEFKYGDGKVEIHINNVK